MLTKVKPMLTFQEQMAKGEGEVGVEESSKGNRDGGRKMMSKRRKKNTQNRIETEKGGRGGDGGDGGLEGAGIGAGGGEHGDLKL